MKPQILITLVCLACVAGLVLLTSFSPHTRSLQLLASLGIFAVFSLLFSRNPRSFSGFIWSAIFVLYTITTVGYYVANFFTSEGITVEVLYQLDPSTFEAATYSLESYQIIAITMLLVFAVLYVYHLRSRTTIPSFSPGALSMGALICAMFVVHPFTTTSYQLFRSLNSDQHAQEIIEIVNQRLHPISSIEKVRGQANTFPNLLVIYLESIERTYNDNRYYSGLTTEIAKLQKSGLDFSNVSIPWGATYTIGGMVASLCGVPINTPMGIKAQDNSSDVYMPNAQCLGDITKSLGYKNLFYQGARLSYTSKGAFMRAHGFDEVRGLHELWDNTIPREQISGPWGLHDKFMLDQVETRLHDLMENPGDQPFMFTVLTLDTHDAFSAGNNRQRYSKWCTERGLDYYPDADHRIEHAIHCSDKLIGEFVNRVQKKWGENLTIILMSDHGALPFNVGPKLRSADRKNHRRLIFSILDDDQNSSEIGKSASTLDIGATILGYITDNGLNNIGLGSNLLLEEQQTMMEKLGYSQLNIALQGSNLDLGKRLWQMPSLADTRINIDPIGKRVGVGQLSYKMPVALLVDDSGKIVDFYGKDARRRLALGKVSARLVWVGGCGRINVMFEVADESQETCIVAGHLGAKEYFSASVSEPVSLEYEELSPFLNPDAEHVSTELTNQRLFLNLETDNEIDEVTMVASEHVGDHAVIDVFATNNIQPNLVVYTKAHSLSDHQKTTDLMIGKPEKSHYGYPTDNGFYLLSIQDGWVDVVHSWKTCAGISHEPVKSVLDRHREKPAFVLVSARKVTCDTRELDQIFSGSVFSSASDLQERQPYIAYYESESDHPVEIKASPGDDAQLRIVQKKVFDKIPSL